MSPAHDRRMIGGTVRAVRCATCSCCGLRRDVQHEGWKGGAPEQLCTAPWLCVCVWRVAARAGWTSMGLPHISRSRMRVPSHVRAVYFSCVAAALFFDD